MAKRRAKGEGSIFKEKSGYWRAVITFPDGSRKYKRAKRQSVVREWLQEQRQAIQINALLKDNKVDCIILDIKMPEVDGLKLLNTIRQENRSIRIVINSAYSHYRQDFSAWGADEYIVKSSDLTELKETIDRLLE